MRNILCCLLLLTVNVSFCQIKPASSAEVFYKGYFYNGKLRSPIKYTISYRESKDNEEAYITSYAIYDKNAKDPKYSITVAHFYMAKLIKVNVFDFSSYEEINSISIFYEKYNLTPFGNKHEFRQDAFQAKVKFANSTYEYVRLIEGECDLAKDSYFMFNDATDNTTGLVEDKVKGTEKDKDKVYAKKLNASQFEIDSYTNATDMYIKKDEKVIITATGSVTYGAWAGSGGPGGIDGYTSYNRVAGFRHGSLLVRVGDSGEWQAVGTSLTFKSDVSGKLQFLINDEDPSNNSGSFVVNVKLSHSN